MPYVNIPDSGLGGAVAKIVGKLLGQVSGKALETARELQNSLSLEGCPIPSQNSRLKGKQKQISSTMSKANKKLNKFKKLPKTLKGPLTGLKAALKIILTLPIPQAVPPGIGLPINITTKYADLMHLLKEAVKQISEVIDSIEVVLELPSQTINNIQNTVSRAETVLKSCDIENALKEEVNNGNITEDNLKQLGLVDEDGVYLYSTLGPVLLTSDKKYRGKWIYPNGYQKYDIVSYNRVKYVCQKAHISDPKGGKESGPPGVGPWLLQSQSEANAYNSLVNSVKSLNDASFDDTIKSRLRAKLLDFEKTLDNSKIGQGGTKIGPNGEILNNGSSGEDESKYFYTGPNGIKYKLEIQDDPDSPPIATRRFAVAIDPSGVTVLKGQKSFSSSTDVLLDEIKFRIDNQLP